MAVGPFCRWRVARARCYQAAVRALALAVLVVIIPGQALAADGERVLSLGMDYATWRVEEVVEDEEVTLVAHGLQLSLEHQRGWTDSFWLRGYVSGGGYEVDGELGYGATATVGLTYAFDVLRYVPFAQLGLGGMLYGGGRVDLTIKPVAELAIGLTVLESTTRSWGVVARFDTYGSKAFFFSVGVRVDWRWGFF
jgi:hypothetical protein